jgi:hypothetical protein
MIVVFGLWALMAAAAVLCGLTLSLTAALATWVGLAAVACVAGAVLLRLQPIGIPTASGRVGGALVHWGFRVGRGRLLPRGAHLLAGLDVTRRRHHRADAQPLATATSPDAAGMDGRWSGAAPGAGSGGHQTELGKAGPWVPAAGGHGAGDDPGRERGLVVVCRHRASQSGRAGRGGRPAASRRRRVRTLCGGDDDRGPAWRVEMSR